MKQTKKRALLVALALLALLAVLRVDPPIVRTHSVLHLAANHDLYSLVRLQLALGVPPDHRSPAGDRTAFIDAVMSNDLPMARLLAAHGADVNHVWASGEVSGNMLSHVAGYTDNAPKVRALLAMGVSTKTTANFGRTPLHWAAVGGHPATIEALLEGGADVNAPDAFGWTPLDLARSNHWPAAAALLIRHGGRTGKGKPHAATSTGFSRWKTLGDPVKSASATASWHRGAHR